jgi:hypothetical protein
MAAIAFGTTALVRPAVTLQPHLAATALPCQFIVPHFTSAVPRCPAIMLASGQGDNQPSGQGDDDTADRPDDISDGRLEDISDLRLLLTVLRRRLPTLFTLDPAKLRLAFSSVITQLGRRAFLFVSSLLTLAAFSIEQLTRRLRRFNLDTWFVAPERLERLVASVQSRLRKTVRNLRYESLANRLFDESDLNNDEGVSPTELYCLCLRLYLAVNENLPQVLTPPTKAQTDALHLSFDVNRDV